VRNVTVAGPAIDVEHARTTRDGIDGSGNAPRSSPRQEVDRMSRAAGSPATLVRVYRGADRADAIVAFQHDSTDLAREGYFPVRQRWSQGPWGNGGRLIALLLMLIVHQAAALTVTYALREAAPAQGS
jgi:hypothetical protein